MEKNMKKTPKEYLEELVVVSKNATQTLEKATKIINDLKKENEELKTLLKKVKELSNEEEVKKLIK
jgi:uncharacterized protein YoxC